MTADHPAPPPVRGRAATPRRPAPTAGAALGAPPAAAAPATGLAHPRFLARLAELGPAADRTWLLALSVGLGFTLIAAYLFAHTPSGNFWAYAGLFVRGGLYLRAGERLKGRGGETLAGLFRLGIVAGLLEVLVDWALIHWVRNGRLVYLTGNDVVILGSPLWMPLAWACVTVELGYPAVRLFALLRGRMAERAAALVASLVAAAGAGLTIGLYEYFAWRANWWKYERAHAMIGQACALYIPLGEFVMFLFALPVAARALAEQDEAPLAAALEGGARFALAIAFGYAVAYLLLEAGRGV